MKKNVFIYEMVNHREIDKSHVDVFVKCARMVLVYRIFYKNKPYVARNYVDSKALTLKP